MNPPPEQGDQPVLASAAANDPPDGPKPARPTSPTEPRIPPPGRVPLPREAPPGDGSADEDVPGVEYCINPADFEVVPSRMADVGDALVSRLRRFGGALLTIARRDRVETISLLLLGVGGAVFPPVWLFGALFALSSRKWDRRDKFIGLALPVLAVILGATMAVALGSQLASYTSYLVEWWVAAGRLSRVAAVLGATYLLWRIHKYRGSRTRRPPPWSPQRKPGR